MAKVEQIFHDYLADIGGAALKHAIPISAVPPYAECASVLSLNQQGNFTYASSQKHAHGLKDRARSKKFETSNQALAKAKAKAKAMGKPDLVPAPQSPAPKSGQLGQLPSKADADCTMAPQLGNFSAQKYYTDRMLPTLHTMTKEAGRLQNYVTWGEITIGAMGVIGSILGALNPGSGGQTVAYVPVCVTLGAVVTSLMQQHALYGRLTALNASVRALSRLDLDWNSASPLEQCNLETITELVETTENARVTVMNAWTCITAGSKRGQTKEEEAEESGQQGEQQQEQGGSKS